MSLNLLYVTESIFYMLICEYYILNPFYIIVILLVYYHICSFGLPRDRYRLVEYYLTVECVRFSCIPCLVCCIPRVICCVYFFFTSYSVSCYEMCFKYYVIFSRCMFRLFNILFLSKFSSFCMN